MEALYRLILNECLNESNYGKLLTIIRLTLLGSSKNESRKSNRMDQIFTPFIEELSKHVYNQNQRIAIAFFLSRLVYLPQLDESIFSKSNISKNNIDRMMQKDATNINFDRNFTDSNLKSLVNSIIKNPIYKENKKMLFYLVLTFIKKFMESKNE
jgi:hypothetical protein